MREYQQIAKQVENRFSTCFFMSKNSRFPKRIHENGFPILQSSHHSIQLHFHL